MISKVMNNIQQSNITANRTNHSPSFGFAKLNDLGRETADAFEYQHNTFLNDAMFKKQGLFQESLLSTQLKKSKNFKNMCITYGCSDNAATNAAFIKNQILISKSKDALSKLSAKELEEGLLTLYMYNYDNPQLSVKETKALLELTKEYMSSEDYIKHAGILAEGTQKK